MKEEEELFSEIIFNTIDGLSDYILVYVSTNKNDIKYILKNRQYCPIIIISPFEEIIMASILHANVYGIFSPDEKFIINEENIK
jgi:hypothetical protein